jgi:hypothetical protein
MEALILVATRGGPTMLARIGVTKALNTGKPEPEITPRRERAKRYRSSDDRVRLRQYQQALR